MKATDRCCQQLPFFAGDGLSKLYKDPLHSKKLSLPTPLSPRFIPKSNQPLNYITPPPKKKKLHQPHPTLEPVNPIPNLRPLPKVIVP